MKRTITYDFYLNSHVPEMSRQIYSPVKNGNDFAHIKNSTHIQVISVLC